MKQFIFSSIITTAFGVASVFAFAPKDTQAFFNGPTVANITNSSADISLSDKVLQSMTPEEKAMTHFEYIETHKVCIMIYPTPKECLPIPTTDGQSSTTIKGLKPGTEYRVVFKHPNTIRCIKDPCPTNDFESMEVVFTTKGASSNGNGEGVGNSNGGIGNIGGGTAAGEKKYKRNISLGMRGDDVMKLQRLLITRGFLTASSTGYFGRATREAVKAYQKSYNLPTTGYIGSMTREKLEMETE